MSEPNGNSRLVTDGGRVEFVQIGWKDLDTGEMCDCPVYEASPHANSEPVLVTREAFDRIRGTEWATRPCSSNRRREATDG